MSRLDLADLNEAIALNYVFLPAISVVIYVVSTLLIRKYLKSVWYVEAECMTIYERGKPAAIRVECGRCNSGQCSQHQYDRADPSVLPGNGILGGVRLGSNGDGNAPDADDESPLAQEAREAWDRWTRGQSGRSE